MSGSGNLAALPAYLRLPDGLRVAGSVTIEQGSALLFSPKQVFATAPPDGLPVELVIAGLPDREEEQLIVAGSVESSNPRQAMISADDALPDALVEHLDPESILWLPPVEEGKRLLERMREEGLQSLNTAMRRFLLALADHLFDLSTSSRYGISGRHQHYDALNNLKRMNDAVIADFCDRIKQSLQQLTKDDSGESFVDLEEATAKKLELVTMDEMEQKLASEKLIGRLIQSHRVDLECLTIRCAFLNEIEPRKARTPFHPAHIVPALVQSMEPVTDSGEVIEDVLAFFDQHFSSELELFYPSLNKIFIDAGLEPGLEDEIREQGSLLNPPEKRIVKSVSRDRPRRTAEADGDHMDRGNSGSSGDAAPNARDGNSSRQSGAPATGNIGSNSNGSDDSVGGAPESARSASKHDAIYDSVMSALSQQRESLKGPETDGDKDATDAEPAVASISENELLAALRNLQSRVQPTDNLRDMPPLAELLNEAGTSPSALEASNSNQLEFVDNVFRTLDRNFEVSNDMAPVLSRLRLPLARLSLQEPKFFTQPDHPAHRLLNELSTLASADHSINRSLRGKLEKLLDHVANRYDKDASVFAEAESEVASLVNQQGQVRQRNVDRVIKGLEGQERLFQAQNRVEELLASNLGKGETPAVLQDLVESGWRTALVQLALREGEDSVPWQEESALLKQLASDLQLADGDALTGPELKEMQMRLKALDGRLQQSNPGSTTHEPHITRILNTLAGREHAVAVPYQSPVTGFALPSRNRVEQLPRLRRWLKRVADLEPGTRLSYRGKDGRRKHMQLVWISEDRNRFAFVNERGQKIAELSAVQLARQLSRGAKPPSKVEKMSLLDQSVYDTLENAQKTLSFARNRDALTRLVNGESLVEQLARTVHHAQSHNAEHAFLLLDIDRFSLVTEIFDDASADQVLIEFSKLLGQLNDRRSLTARLEGDEFGILLTYRSLQEAREIAEKVRSDIGASAVQVGGEPVSFTVSLGVASVSQETESAKAVIDQARTALETAKRQGRDQVQVYAPNQSEILEYQRERDASRKRLDEAMSTDRLVMRAQPIVQTSVDGSKGASHHYELLLSLRDEAGELQSPQEFIMSAERFGYITLVDRWVIREVFSWISCLMDKQKAVPELSINLSGSSVTDNDFLDYILEQISEWGVGTSKLCFEITETGAIDNLPRAADFVRTLRNLGCRFSLDDFGSGLASHRYLKELPVDYVKIDGGFITDVHKSSTDYAMVKSINELAHFLGQKTVAECVETLDIIPTLREIGIDYLQGWGIGMPRPLDEVTRELSNLET